MSVSNRSERRTDRAAVALRNRSIRGVVRPARSGAGARTLRFLAEIIAYELCPGETARWRYAWREVIRSGDGVAVKPDGRTGSVTEDYAINLCEVNNLLQHVGTQGNSVDQSRVDYPEGFELQPVGGEAGVFVVIEMTQRQDDEGEPVYDFNYENADDGCCAIC